MEKCKRERTQLRRLFTVAIKEVKEKILEDPVNKIEVLASFSILQDRALRLFKLDESINDLWLETDEFKEDEYAKEYEMMESYRNEWNIVKRTYDDLLCFQSTVLQVNTDRESSSELKTGKRNFRLPKLELKHFDGNIRNWLGFWGQFKKIDEDDSIDEEDKFQYLIQSTAPQSPARELVESFPPSAANYDKAIEQLKSRFARDELLIEIYVRELLNIVLSQATKGKTMSLGTLYDKLETQLRALESLGVTRKKYAAMLYPLVESALPEDILRVWERSRKTKERKTAEEEKDEYLASLLEFLKFEVEGEERLRLTRSGFGIDNTATIIKRVSNKTKDLAAIPSAAALISSGNAYSHKVACVFCDKSSHASQDCAAIIDSSMEEKTAALRKKGACYRCLKPGHQSKKCRAFVKCIICKRQHYTIMCSNQANKADKAKESTSEETLEINMSVNSQERMKVTYLQTLVADVVDESKRKKVRILCDSGSQKSYITKRCAMDLNLKSTGNVSIQHELFGGRKTTLSSHKTYQVTLKSLDTNFQCKVNLLDEEKICSVVPKIKDVNLYEKLKRKGITLTDFSKHNDISEDIEILLGADAWSQIITAEYYEVSKNLVAIKTRLGWSLVGSTNDSTISSNLLVNFLCTKEVPKMWDLETLGILEPGVKISQEERDREVTEFFEKTVDRDATGRYIVKLPWIEGHPMLEDNKQAAEKRLQVTTRKLNQINKYTEYDSVFRNWLRQGIIEKVDPTSEVKDFFYLPHRAVFKESNTTPVRPVFDASTKDKNGHSLNESLEKGPNLIDLIPITLLRFRKYPIAISADIEKAFLQIGIHPADRDKLRFLWWEDNRIITLRHCRVVFGVSCSPFLLGAVINKLLESAPSHLKHIADKLKNSFYIDNCLTGVDSKEELDQFIIETRQLMSSAGFNLRGWTSSVSNEDVRENILGLQWYCAADELGCNLRLLNNYISPHTKRSLLSIAQKIFDPIGFTAPVMLIPKILLQRTWTLKLGWDEILPEDIQKEFNQWIDNFDCLEDCKIPRKIIINESSTIHVFCDASKIAYASCIFLRTEVEEKVFIYLIVAKSRIAPTKILTVPRLELMAALIGVRLYISIQEVFSNIQTYFWSDSTVTLAWIINQGPWSVFIENRVQEIRKYSQTEFWRHIPGNINPADLLSRGCKPLQLLKSRWWEGPSWLFSPFTDWPSTIPTPEVNEVERERRKIVIAAKNSIPESILAKIAERISSYLKIVRIVAWILRFSPNAKENRKGSDISTEEFMNAENIVFRCIQLECFNEEAKKTSLKGLQVFTDDNAIIRMKSRLIAEEEIEEYIYPIILPAKHPVVERMIEQQHLIHKHAGTLALMTILRERVWNLKGRKTVNSVVRRCMVCKRSRAKAMEVPIPPLPKDRTRITATFQVTGVDLAGPIYTRSKEKFWIVIFTCAVYRAVHLELIQSLSSGAFIQALRRFIARRGRISVIYSDNGTNFVGVNRALCQLDWNEIERESSLHHIRWKFNPPTAPWWGGFWERLIRILKDLLRKNLGRASLNYEELITLLCECESVMNNRPLTYVSEESDELCVLKPSMFVQSLTGNDVSDLDQIEKINLVRRWNYLQKVRESLRRRFKREYLAFLHSIKKHRADTIKVGDIVLVGADNKRLNWDLGRIVELIPGKDHVNRLVKVKIAKGCQLRPIQRLYPLEVSHDADLHNNVFLEPEFQKSTDVNKQPIASEIETVHQTRVTRSGRVVKTPERIVL